MNLINLKAYVCAVLGAIGGAVATLFGGWSEDMVTLVIFMAIDFLMGLVLAGVFHKSSKTESGSLNSRAGWKGLCKKCVALIFVLVARRLDVSLGTDYIRSATIIAFIVNEALSIIENAGLMGVPLPRTITKAVDVLKDREAK